VVVAAEVVEEVAAAEVVEAVVAAEEEQEAAAVRWLRWRNPRGKPQRWRGIRGTFVDPRTNPQRSLMRSCSCLFLHP
jgi:hypothetical protein